MHVIEFEAGREKHLTDRQNKNTNLSLNEKRDFCEKWNSEFSSQLTVITRLDNLLRVIKFH